MIKKINMQHIEKINIKAFEIVSLQYVTAEF